MAQGDRCRVNAARLTFEVDLFDFLIGFLSAKE